MSLIFLVFTDIDLVPWYLPLALPIFQPHFEATFVHAWKMKAREGGGGSKGFSVSSPRVVCFCFSALEVQLTGMLLTCRTSKHHHHHHAPSHLAHVQTALVYSSPHTLSC